MKHARDEALDRLAPLLERIRALSGVREAKRGAFYAGRLALVHFHEDTAGLFADVRGAGGWARFAASTKTEHRAVLEAVARELALRAAAPMVPSKGARETRSRG